MEEKLFIISKPSGYELHCSLFSGNHEKLLIWCHGGLGDRYEHGRFSYAAKKLINEGYDSVLFDFSGAGKNERTPITNEKMISDLEEIWKWGHGQYAVQTTIGLSIGGLISLIAELPNRPCAVFWSPAFFLEKTLGPLIRGIAKTRLFISSKPIKIKPATGGDHLQIDQTFINGLTKFDVKPYLQKFSTPALIVQGSKDIVVRPKNTTIAYNLMPSGCKHYLEFVDGAPHDFRGKFVDEYIKYTLDFLNENL